LWGGTFMNTFCVNFFSVTFYVYSL